MSNHPFFLSRGWIDVTVDEAPAADRAEGHPISLTVEDEGFGQFVKVALDPCEAELIGQALIDRARQAKEKK